MKPMLIAGALAAWAAVASGCSSGDVGPATSPILPFGTEPTASTGPEPTVGGAEGPPGRGGQTIAQLCAIDCARIDAACPGSAGSNCVTSCSSVPSSAAGCTAQFQAYLACVSTAPLSCITGSVQISSCETAQIAVSSCANQGGA